MTNTVNPYLDLMQGEEDRRRQQEAATLTTAVDTNADQYAVMARVASYLGYPVAAVEATPEASNREAQVKQIQQTTATRPVLQQKYSDADFAKLAHDDHTTLGKLTDAITATVRYLTSADSNWSFAGDSIAAYHGVSRGYSGAFGSLNIDGGRQLNLLVGSSR